MSVLGLSSKEADAAKAAQLAKYFALKEKKKLLEDQLNRKLEELYDACAKEAVSHFSIFSFSHVSVFLEFNSVGARVGLMVT